MICLLQKDIKSINTFPFIHGTKVHWKIILPKHPSHFDLHPKGNVAVFHVILKCSTHKSYSMHGNAVKLTTRGVHGNAIMLATMDV